jgi:hypothetical protein
MLSVTSDLQVHLALGKKVIYIVNVSIAGMTPFRGEMMISWHSFW